ncbi:MAG: FAD-binding oxidoreductase [Candidatus Ranarchaeia archaeon]
MAKSLFEKAVKGIVGEKNISSEKVDRIAYSQSCTFEKAGLPALIVRPQSSRELSKIFRLANLHKKPVWIWGRGTLFVGSGVRDGFTIIDMTAMNKLIKIDKDNLCVTCQAGMTWGALNGELKKHGWELTVQGSGGLVSATVGGTIASNAVPHGLTKGGMTAEGVINLEVVLPTGETVRTGSASNPAGRPFFRFGNGADLTGLFIGSCGAFGAITEATLKIKRVASKEAFFCFGYDSYKNAYDAVKKMQKTECARFIVAVQGDLPEETEAQTLLHIILDGTVDSVAENSAIAEEINKRSGGKALDNTGTRNYWTSHDVMYSWLRWKDKFQYYRWRSSSRPYFCPEVTAVLPFPELTNFTGAFWKYWNGIRDKREKVGAFLKGFDIYFARGGGSIWIDTLYPADDKEAVDYGFHVQKKLFEMVLQYGGSVPLIGAGVQARYTIPRLGAYYGLLKTLKKSLDPNRILNPGVLAI